LEIEEHEAKGTPPTRVFFEKRLQAIEKKGWRCEILGKEGSKRRQALNKIGLGR
jgi:hypothetical protein